MSDLDDTVKITNVSRPYRATINGLFKKNIFTGMPQFLNEARSYAHKLHLLSASPAFIRKSVSRTLNSHGIQTDSLYLRNIIKERSTYRYKLRRITRLLESTDDDFILLGDDVNLDPEIYEEIQRLFPGRILAIYIHVINGRKLPASAQPYYYSAELALREYEAGRLNSVSTQKVLQAVIDEDLYWYIRPGFSRCPRERAQLDWQLQTDFAQEAEILIDRLVDYCNTRRTVRRISFPRLSSFP